MKFLLISILFLSVCADEDFMKEVKCEEGKALSYISYRELEGVKHYECVDISDITELKYICNFVEYDNLYSGRHFITEMKFIDGKWIFKKCVVNDIIFNRVSRSSDIVNFKYIIEPDFSPYDLALIMYKILSFTAIVIGGLCIFAFIILSPDYLVKYLK